MLRFTLPALFAASVLAACGSRSTLLDGASAPGSGGGLSTSSSASSPTSSSSSSGAPLTCKELFLSGDPITYEPTSFEHGTRPTLVPVTEDGTLVSVVHARQLVEGPTGPPFRIAHATFAPWGAWPSTLGPTDQAVWFGGEAFAVAPAAPAGQPGFALSFYRPTDAAPENIYLAPSVEPHTSYEPYPEGVAFDGVEPAWVVALARGATSYLAAYQREIPGDPSVYMKMGIVDADSLGAEVYPGIACAKAAFPAAAVPSQGGFLLAAASGRKFAACGLDDGIPGPADEVQVTRFDLGKKDLTLSAAFQQPDPLVHVLLAKASHGGAWVAWRNNGASAEFPPPIQAARLDEAGFQTGPVFDVATNGQPELPFAIAALGDLLAVVWIDTLDPGPPTLRLDLLDASGAFVTGASINTGPSWLHDSPLSLLPAPNGKGLLLAWSDMDSPEPAIVRVARFTCAGGQ
jgi:hypothetical protein